MEENVGGCFFLNTVYSCQLHASDALTHSLPGQFSMVAIRG